MHTVSQSARERIDAHRLMRQEPVPPEAEAAAERHQARRAEARARGVRRLWVHIGAFVAAYVYTAGVALIGILLWVRPDTLLPLVELGILAAVVFVIAFSTIRVVVLHHVFRGEYEAEEDPGMEHHVAKSVAYGFVALALAVLVTGLLVNLASASSSYKLSSYQATSSA